MEAIFEAEQRVLHENARLLGDQSLEHLRRYKYSSVDRSLLSYYVLNPFWTWCVRFMPVWLAPNVITLIGISAILGCNFLVLVLQNGNLYDDMPRIVYFLFGISFFFYQTMDNIDGKQARRTGTSSPLGELFDHGIDSLNCLWGALLMVASCGQGSSWMGVVSLVAPMLGMYFSAWETFYTKTLFLDYLNAPTEGLIVAMSIHFAAAIWGPEIWKEPFSSDPNSSLHNVKRGILWTGPLLISVLFLHIPSCVCNVYRHCQRNNAPDHRSLTDSQDSTQSLWKQVFANIWPIVFIVAAMLVWCGAPNGVILGDPQSPQDGHLFLFGWCLAFTFGRVSTTIILSHLCQSSKFPHFSFPVMLLFGGAVGYGVLPRIGFSWTVISEINYLRLYFVLSGVYFFGFASIVIDRITQYLGIRAFTVPGDGLNLN